MTRDYINLPFRVMTHHESVAFGLYAGNLINAADREGVSIPCGARIREAWDNDSRARERWINTVDIIINGTDLTLSDLGSSKAEFSRVPLSRCKTALDVATACLISGFLGVAITYLIML